LELFQSDPKTHYSAEEVHNYLIKNNESIGLATIYRVLTQLETAGLLQKNNFDDSTSTYEIKKQHHDHLICTECGKIIEFIDEDLEVMQEKISKKHNFKLTSHVMTLFGTCSDSKCVNRKKS
jgi:Fur family ferric uptake transcriptional regulator